MRLSPLIARLCACTVLMTGCGQLNLSTDDVLDDVKGGAEQVKEGASDALGDLSDSFDEALDAANDYIEGPQLEQRRHHCDRDKGTWVERVEISPCRDGEATLNFDGAEEVQRCGSGEGGVQTFQCMFRDAQGRAYFNDGPSTPPSLQTLSGLHQDLDLGRWAELFWDAAVNHDYCYHHNGITRQLSQRDCDVQMLQDLSAVCAAPQVQAISWFEEDTCRRHAALAYLSVRAYGEDNFVVQNTEVNYPLYQPMQEKLGLSPQDIDGRIQQEADKMLESWDPRGLL